MNLVSHSAMKTNGSMSDLWGEEASPSQLDCNLLALDKVTEIPFYEKELFAKAYKSYRWYKRELRSNRKLLRRIIEENRQELRNQCEVRIKQYEAELAKHKSICDQSKFKALRDALKGNYKPSISVSVESKPLTAKDVGTMAVGLVGMGYFAFIGLSLLAVLLFGVIGLVRGCRWTPSESDTQRLEMLP